MAKMSRWAIANGYQKVNLRTVAWRALVSEADPDWHRVNQRQVEYEFSAPRRGGIKRMYGRTSERGPYAD